jgi:hypothetical protein
VPWEVYRQIQAGGANGFAIPEFEQAVWLHEQAKPVINRLAKEIYKHERTCP